MDKIEMRLEFVRRVSDEIAGTLNAASAIARVQMLIDDAQRIAESFKASPPENPYGTWRTFPVEITSYYSVGLVTCLEWHARSRLADLLTFKPEAISEDDLRKDVSAKSLSYLIAAQASIPQFVAATRNISTAEVYLATFARIFKAIGIGQDARAMVASMDPVAASDGKTGMHSLDAIFSYRNMLVHEISSTQIGHPMFHDAWSCEAAIAYGQFVMGTMLALETLIARAGPVDFPNKLSPDGAPADADALLDSEILKLEKDISNKIEGFKTACKVSRAALVAELSMLFESHELHSRWLDNRAAPRRTLRKGRLAYLRALHASLE